jgi:broad specificity phosphatase PhoE
MARRLLYLARHGETDWNLAGRWQGHTDIALNRTGHSQAQAMADALAQVAIATIVSSDLSRAFETARVVGERLGVPVAYMDADLRERSFGLFEGLTRDQCVTLHPQAWRAWVEDHRAPEGAESRAAVMLRVTRAIDRIAQRADGGPVLVVTHGGALRAAVSTVAALPPPVANGAIWRIEWDEAIVAAHAFAPGG